MRCVNVAPGSLSERSTSEQSALSTFDARGASWALRNSSAARSSSPVRRATRHSAYGALCARLRVSPCMHDVLAYFGRLGGGRGVAWGVSSAPLSAALDACPDPRKPATTNAPFMQGARSSSHRMRRSLTASEFAALSCTYVLLQPLFRLRSSPPGTHRRVRVRSSVTGLACHALASVRRNTDLLTLTETQQ